MAGYALLSLLVISCLTVVYLFRNELWTPPIVSQTPPKSPQPQPEKYASLKEDLAIRRQRLAKRYGNAQSETERNAILQESRTLLEAVLPEMMRCWLGTPWDFHGTSQTPGEGKIACGYFVSTIMRDAGFRLHRIKLAQQASQTILRTFVDKSRTTIRVAVEYQTYLEWVASKPKGVYIVGLDNHVGFIVHNDNGIHFIHSSGSDPFCVVDEVDEQASALKKSRYRVIGNVTAEKETLKKWLKQSWMYPVKTS